MKKWHAIAIACVLVLAGCQCFVKSDARRELDGFDPACARTSTNVSEHLYLRYRQNRPRPNSDSDQEGAYAVRWLGENLLGSACWKHIQLSKKRHPDWACPH